MEADDRIIAEMELLRDTLNAYAATTSLARTASADAEFMLSAFAELFSLARRSNANGIPISTTDLNIMESKLLRDLPSAGNFMPGLERDNYMIRFTRRLKTRRGRIESHSLNVQRLINENQELFYA